MMMMMVRRSFINVLVALAFVFAATQRNTGEAFQPEFAEPIVNLSVVVGRDAVFRCLVHHLGGYRVGWVKADTKAIQAIHDHVITHNPRVSVSHNDHTTWNLHMHNVQEEDRGQYMCQINTDPMKSQVGYLDVVVPPDFINERTSGDVMVSEGATVKLSCKARGHPEPHVIWRREDGHDLIIRETNGQKSKVSSYKGEILKLIKVSRMEMGAYMCIASNGIPPTVSKRIMVHVHFHPVIQVPNQLVGAPLGTDVQLQCHIESSPKAINYWVRDTGEMVVASDKYHVHSESKSMFEVDMTVVIKNIQAEDVGSYKCVAKNSLGEVESNIRLYEILGPTRHLPTQRYNEDLIDQYGQVGIEMVESTEVEDFHVSNNVEHEDNNKHLLLSPSPSIVDHIRTSATSGASGDTKLFGKYSGNGNVNGISNGNGNGNRVPVDSSSGQHITTSSSSSSCRRVFYLTNILIILLLRQ